LKTVTENISISELQNIAENGFGDFVKAVVDTEKEIMAIDAELHADEESLLLDEGSAQDNLWGINIYPFKEQKEWVEFDSMINIRPRQGNRSRDVEDAATRNKIIEIVNKLILVG
jgi:hypothetical protein